MRRGKCPKCEKILNSVNIDDIDLIAKYRSPRRLQGVSYLCPFCDSILGIGFDPDLLSEDIRQEIRDQVDRLWWIEK